MAAAQQNTAIATQGPRDMAAKERRTISDLLQGPELKGAVKAALPKHLTPERFIRVALNATLRTPKLLQCSRESFFKALLDLSSFGLEPDGRRAHLIPYGNEVQLIIDYKGLVELVRRSGDVSYIHADVVYENDEWDFGFGSEAFLKHRPNLDERGDRVKAVYSFVKLKDGSEDFMVMSRAEVEKVRKRSKASGNGPWVTDWEEMAKKTVFRRHSKWLPLSAEARDAVEHDDEFVGVDLGPEKAALSLAQVIPSEDENRGHDATAPGSAAQPQSDPSPQPAASGPATESQPAPPKKPPTHIEDMDEWPDDPTLPWYKIRGELFFRDGDTYRKYEGGKK